MTSRKKRLRFGQRWWCLNFRHAAMLNQTKLIRSINFIMNPSRFAITTVATALWAVSPCETQDEHEPATGRWLQRS